MSDDLSKIIESLSQLEGHTMSAATNAMSREEVHLMQEAVLQCMSAIIVDLASQTIVWSTPVADRMFGYLEGELIGKQLEELVALEARSRHANHFVKYAADPHPRQMGSAEMQLLGVTSQGAVIEVEIGLYPRMVAGRRAVIATIVQHRTTND